MKTETIIVLAVVAIGGYFLLTKTPSTPHPSTPPKTSGSGGSGSGGGSGLSAQDLGGYIDDAQKAYDFFYSIFGGSGDDGSGDDGSNG